MSITLKLLKPPETNEVLFFRFHNYHKLYHRCKFIFQDKLIIVWDMSSSNQYALHIGNKLTTFPFYVKLEINSKRKVSLRLFSFHLFFIFHQMIALQKLWKTLFIPSKKLFSILRYSNFSNFFPFLSTLSKFKNTNESGITCDVMNWLAEISRCNFWNNSKADLHYILHHQTWSGDTSPIKEVFWTCFVTLRTTGH